MKPLVNASYAKVVNYLEREHYVPIRTRYWDRADVETKEMRTTRREDRGIVIANHSVYNQRDETVLTCIVTRMIRRRPTGDSAEASGAAS